MAIVILVVVLAILALATQAGVLLVQRSFPAQGRMVEVAGGALHVVDIGPRDGAAPIVMLHGASSNLEVMRQPLGDRLARDHRVILIDRPGHGWSTRARFSDSTPEIQGRMIAEALSALGVERAVFVVHSWSGALGLRLALDYPERVLGLVMLAPVAYPWPGGVGRYNQVIATPVIGPLLAYTITLPLGRLLAESGARGVFLPQTMPDVAPARIHRQCARPGDAKGGRSSAGAPLWRDHRAGHHHQRRCRQDGVDQNPFAPACGHAATCKTGRAARRRPHGAECGIRCRDRRNRGDDRRNAGQDGHGDALDSLIARDGIDFSSGAAHLPRRARCTPRFVKPRQRPARPKS